MFMYLKLSYQPKPRCSLHMIFYLLSIMQLDLDILNKFVFTQQLNLILIWSRSYLIFLLQTCYYNIIFFSIDIR